MQIYSKITTQWWNIFLCYKIIHISVYRSKSKINLLHFFKGNIQPLKMGRVSTVVSIDRSCPLLHFRIIFNFLKEHWPFKGTVSLNEFGFWWHAWLVLGLKRGGDHFFSFLGVPTWFQIAKSVFLAVNASLRWLNNVSCFFIITANHKWSIFVYW